MYCKFCGNKIVSNASQCMRCGARINLADGGQTFYEENELDSWVAGSGSNIPQTEIRTTPYGRKKIAKRNGKKPSGSNKLIVFCIISALVIVLLVVAIIAISNKDGGEEGSVVGSDASSTSDAAEVISDGIHPSIKQLLPNDSSTTGITTNSDGSSGKSKAANDAKGKIATEDKAIAEAKSKAKEAKKESKQQAKKTDPAPQDAPKSEEAKKDSGSGGSAVGGSTVGGSTGGSTGGDSTGSGSTGGGNSSVSSPTTEAAKFDTSVWE